MCACGHFAFTDCFMDIDDLNPPERAVLQGTLEKDEELLWVGQPKPRLWTVLSTLICLCGLAPMVFGAVLLPLLWGEDKLFLLMACVFGVNVPLLLVVVAAPWIYRSWQRRCVYALTPKRAIVIRYLLGKYRFRNFFDLEKQPKEHRGHVDGTVSLIMGTSNISATNGRPDPEGFLHLPSDAWQEPKQLLRRMAKNSRKNVTE